MTETAQLRLPAEPTRLTRHWIALAAIVLVLGLVALVAWRTLREDDAHQAALKARTTAQLPATPEDIEQHGERARSTLAPDDARVRNAAVAFAAGPFVLAKPFLFQGSETDRTRALECLAAAVLYEAGDDAVGQSAVAQVVLNRVRHAAFPGTVCGVVYQGSQRRTGCQFSFTCDGSLRRVMPDAMWARARVVARAALDGRVDASVGLATHYHTDWVYPYWSPSLDKLARVGTHLFFGWPGGWGSARAFAKPYRGNETAGAAIVADMPVLPGEAGATILLDPGQPAILGLPQDKAQLPAALGNVPLYGSSLRLVGGDGQSFGLLAPPGIAASKLVNAALALCGQPGPCRVNAWSNEDDIPGSFPMPEGAKATMVFEYVRGGGGSASPWFDCELFPSKDPSRCLSPRAKLEDVLPGVRWKSD